MDRDTAKEYAASILGLASGHLAEGARPDVQETFDKVLPETLLEARKALISSRQILSKTAAPSPATPPEGAEAGEEPATESKPISAKAPPTPADPEPIEAPLPFLDEVGLPPVDEDPPPPAPAPRAAKPIPPKPIPGPAKPAAASVKPPVAKAPEPPAPDPFAGLTLGEDDLQLVKSSEKPAPTPRAKKTPESAGDAPKETAESMGLRNLFGALRDEKKSAFDDLLSDVAPTPPEEPAAEVEESSVENEPETVAEPEADSVEEPVAETPEEDPLAGFDMPGIDADSTESEPAADAETETDPLADLPALGDEEEPAASDAPAEAADDPLAGLLDIPEDKMADEDPLAGADLDFGSSDAEETAATANDAETSASNEEDPLGGLDLGDLTSSTEDSKTADAASEDPLAGLDQDGIPELPDFGAEEEPEAPAEPVQAAPKAKAKPAPAPETSDSGSTLSDDDILALTGTGDPSELGQTPAESETDGGNLDFGSLELPGEETPAADATEEETSADGDDGADPLGDFNLEAEVGAGEGATTQSDDGVELPEVHSEDPDHLAATGADFEGEAQPVSLPGDDFEPPETASAPAPSASFALPEAGEDEDPRLREAFIYLKTFSEANRRIVYDAVTSGLLSERESELVFRDLVDGRDEENLVRWIYDRLVEKHKLAPSAKSEGRGPSEKVLLKANFWPLLRLALLGLLVLALLIPGGIWVGKKIRAGSLYASGLKEIEARHWPEAESDFNRAFELSPSLSQTRKYAERYIARGRYVDAEEKYRLALTLKPEHFDTLLDWARLSIRKEDWPDAMARLKKLDKEGKGPDVVREEMVRALVEWGRTEPERYGEADKMLNTLLLRKPKSLPYLGRKMQVAALEGRYPAARNWYAKIQEQDPKFVDGEMFGDFLKLLVDRYERQHRPDPLNPGKKSPPAGFQDDQLYLVKNIEKVGRDIYGKTKEDIALYWNMARWKKMLGEGPKARRWAEEGVATWERLGSARVFQASRLYTLLGDILLDEGKVNDAAARYASALEMDPENPMALYRMGRVQLEHLDQLSNAWQSFQKSRLHWKEPEGLEYAGLLHGLSFTSYFLDGGVGEETAETPARSNLTQALRYWTELRDTVGPNYLVEYALGAVYVRMGEPQLAWGVQGSAIQDLSRHLKSYYDNVNYVSRDLRQRMEILSDLYNNQAVAELALADRGRDRDLHRRSAARLLIDSIELKEKLGLARGAPTANFFNLRGGGKAGAEGWRLSDSKIPKRMDFRSGQTP